MNRYTLFNLLLLTTISYPTVSQTSKIYKTDIKNAENVNINGGNTKIENIENLNIYSKEEVLEDSLNIDFEYHKKDGIMVWPKSGVWRGVMLYVFDDTLLAQFAAQQELVKQDRRYWEPLQSTFYPLRLLSRKHDSSWGGEIVNSVYFMMGNKTRTIKFMVFAVQDCFPPITKYSPAWIFWKNIDVKKTVFIIGDRYNRNKRYLFENGRIRWYPFAIKGEENF